MPTTFAVKVTDAGENEQQVLRLISNLFGLDRPEIERRLDGDGIIADGLDGDTAERRTERLRGAGATVERIPQSPEHREGRRLVHGVVRTEGGSPVAGLHLQAFHKDNLRTELPLSDQQTSVKTGNDGQYDIEYFPGETERDDGEGLNLLVRAYNALDEDVAESAVVFDAAADESVDLVVDPEAAAELSEYVRLQLNVNPALGGESITRLSEEERAFVINDTGLNERIEEFPAGRESLSELADSMRFASETGLPTVVFYGLSRKGVRLDPGNLSSTTPEVLRRTLASAADDHIIPRFSDEELDTVLDQFEETDFEIDREPPNRHRFNGRVLTGEGDEDTPVAGYRVRLTGPDGDPRVTNSASGVTGRAGQFTVTYVRQPDDPELDELTLQVMDASDEVVLTRPFRDVRPAGEDEVFEIRVPESTLPTRLTVPLEEVQEQAGLAVSRTDLEALADHGVHSIADVRRLGLPDGIDDSTATSLRAHAVLNLLPTSLAIDAELIERGYTHPALIAETLRTTFLDEVTSETLTEQDAEAAYQASVAITRFAKSRHTANRADWRNNIRRPTPVEAGGQGDQDEAVNADVPLHCSCDECETAVTPRAYLADLLDYTIKSLVIIDSDDGGAVDGDVAPVSLDFLTSTFFQPFVRLLESCETAEDRVRQARLCSEVLLQYLGEEKLQAVALESTDEDETLLAYRLEAYDALLNQLGTSADELRDVVVHGDPDDAETLANRLGISVEHLPDLLLSSTAPLEDDQLVSEPNLESVFGLQAFTDVTSADQFTVPEETGLLYVGQTGAMSGFEPDESVQLRRQAPDGTSSDIRTVDADEDGTVTITLSAADVGQGVGVAEFTVVGNASTVSFTGSPDEPADTRILIPDPLRHTGTPLPEQSLVHAWQLDFVRDSWRAQDYPDDVYPTGTHPIIDPDLIGPDDFRNPDPDADGSANAIADRAFALWMQRRQWVDTRLQIMDDVVAASEGHALDALFKRMTNSMRYGVNETLGSLDAIEGIGPTLMERLEEAGLESVEDAAGARREDLENIEGISEELAETILSRVHVGPDSAWPDGVDQVQLDALLDDLGTEDPPTRDEATEMVTDTLHLGTEAFRRLMELSRAYERWHSGSSQDALQPDEWEEIYSILLQGQKTSLFPTWRQEENEQAIPLGPQSFWLSLSDPDSGPWPAALDEEYTAELELSLERTPYIDPELVDKDDLPDAVAGHTARLLWADRTAELNEKRTELEEAYWDDGFDALLTAVYGDLHTELTEEELDEEEPWAAYFAARFDELETGTQADLERIAEDADTLELSIEQFEQLAGMGTFAIDSEGGPPEAATLEVIVGELTTVWKRRTKYPDPDADADAEPGMWIQEERDAQVRTYWLARKARLPRWRADKASRQTWQTTLRAHSRPPVLDPDLVAEADLVTPSVGDDTFELLVERREQVGQLRESVRSARPSVEALDAVPAVTTDQFDAMLDLAMGISSADIEALVKAEARGEDISSRLEQVTLSRRAFAYLVDIIDRLSNDDANGDGDDDENAVPIVEEEWRNVDSILTQVQKERRFAVWRETEDARGMSLSPVFFTSEEPGAILEPTTTAPNERWLHDEAVRRRWERTLEARIDQQDGIAEALSTAVEETEEDVVTVFRDILIDTVDTPPGSDPAEWLTDRFRIDMQTDGCQETTRASQAIDVLQGLFFALETGTGLELLDDVELEISNEDYGEQWQWMQSYATWKAAMLVFMYPENFLLPTFRETQTPVFRDLVDELGSGGGVTPSRARWAAGRYTDYLRDVFSLRVEAICETLITPGSETPTSSDGSDQEPKRLVYMFAKGDETKTLYWSVYDYSKKENRSQSYWRPLLLPPEDTRDFDIIGATITPELHSNGDLLLLLRQWPRGSETPNLVYATYDLDDQRWQRGDKHLELASVPLPHEDRNFSAKLVQGCTVPEVLIAFETRLEDKYEVRVFPNLGGTLDFTDANYILAYTGETAPTDSEKKDETKSETRATEWKPSRIKGLGVLYNRFLAAVAEPILDVDIFEHPGLSGSPQLISKKEQSYHRIFIFRSEMSDAGANTELAVNVVDTYHRPSLYWNKLAEGIGLSWQGALITKAELKKQKFSELDPNLLQGTTGQIHAFWEDTNGQSVQSSLASVQIDEASGAKDSQSMSLGWVNVSDPKPSFVNGEDIDGQFAVSTNHKGTPDLVVYRTLADQELPETKRVRVSLYFSAIPARPGTSYHVAPVKSITPIPEIEQQLANAATHRSQLTTLHEDNLVPDVHQTYLHEGYYFLPLHLALQLQRGGHYEDALDWLRTMYDYSTEVDRRVSYLLTQEGELGTAPVHERPADWLYSGINPHAYASLRTSAYTRYTLFTIVKCLLDYADQEFTQDTTESVSRARKLYRTALSILESEGLHGVEDPCDTIQITVEEAEPAPDGPPPMGVWIGDEKIPIQVGATNRAHVRVSLASLSNELDEIREFGQLQAAAEEIEVALRADDDSSALDRIAVARAAVERIRDSDGVRSSFDQLLRRNTGRHSAVYRSIVADPHLTSSAAWIGAAAGRTLSTVSVQRAGPDGDVLEVAPPDVGLSETLSRTELLSNTVDIPIGTFIDQFCLPENPILSAFRARAELSLHKIRTCRNIAGMERELEPYAAPIDVESGLPAFGGGQLPLPQTSTIQPTPYRYNTLIQRTKEVVGLARQMEADFLRFLERRDEEAFRILQAQQGIQQARSNVRLQDLRIREAEDGIELAELQRKSADIRAENFDRWIEAGLNEWERKLIESYDRLALLQTLAASFGASATGLSAFAGAEGIRGYSFATGVAVSAVAQATFESLAAYEQSAIQEFGLRASHERRQQEWELQRALAEQDIAIGGQQVTLARDKLRIAGQERNIAELRTEHAEAIVSFLTEKFTNEELYDWMAEVLEDVYRHFLQQATSMAKLAEHQLAFERQETPPQFIQMDYWEPPQENTIGDIDSTAPDRRGLTGAERLLQDIYELDQYAFNTDERKHHLKKTLSLARLAPVEFQEFCDTGVLTFGTPMELFDRDHPGHHLRLIKRVDVSVIALTPPTEGVHATLTASGISRVVTPGMTFQTRIIRRQPESIALSSPQSEETFLALRQESEGMLLPFEKMGVDTTWEFRMPEAANQFDYDTIADVLVTVHYTALDSYDYRQQVTEELGTEASGERAFSFRETFADQWYDLNNPDVDSSQRVDGDPAPMTVQFETTLDDFPPNIEDVGIDHVLLYFVGDGGRALDGHEIDLLFDDGSGRGTVGGPASPVDGKISTRQTNGINWSSISGTAESANGEWTLSLPHPETRITHPEVDRVGELFTEEEIEDILFVITYSGRHPDWPE